MALVKSVPDGAELVEVTEVISAGAFWVVEGSSNPNGWSKARAQLNVLEMFLASAKCTTIPRSGELQIDELVAVQLQSGSWHRGRVLSIGSSECSVLLIDHGRTVNVPDKDIRDIDERLTKQKPLAFCLKLFGVLPAKTEIDYYRHKMQTCVAERWSLEAYTFVKQYIDKSSTAYLFPKDVRISDKVMFGELYLVSEKGFLNLGLLLSSNNYAVMDLQLFVEKNGLNCKTLSSSHSSESESSLLLADTRETGRKRINQELKSTASSKALSGKLTIDMEEERKQAMENVQSIRSTRLSNDPDTRYGRNSRATGNLLCDSHTPSDQEVNESVIRQKHSGRKLYPPNKNHAGRSAKTKTEFSNKDRMCKESTSHVCCENEPSVELDRSVFWDAESPKEEDICRNKMVNRVSQSSGGGVRNLKMNSQEHVRRKGTFFSDCNWSSSTESQEHEANCQKSGVETRARRSVSPSSPYQKGSFKRNFKYSKSSSCRNDMQHSMPEHLKETSTFYGESDLSYGTAPPKGNAENPKRNKFHKIGSTTWSSKCSQNKSSNSDTESSSRGECDSRNLPHEHLRKGTILQDHNLPPDAETFELVRRSQGSYPKPTIGRKSQSPDYSFQHSIKRDTKYASRADNSQARTHKNSNREASFYNENNWDSETQEIDTKRSLETSRGKNSWSSEDSYASSPSNKNTGFSNSRLNDSQRIRELSGLEVNFGEDSKQFYKEDSKRDMQTNLGRTSSSRWDFQRDESSARRSTGSGSMDAVSGKRSGGNLPQKEIVQDYDKGHNFSHTHHMKKHQKPVRTFFPAGFNMGEADKVFVDTMIQHTAKGSSVSSESENANCLIPHKDEKKKISLLDSGSPECADSGSSSLADMKQKLIQRSYQNLQSNTSSQYCKQRKTNTSANLSPKLPLYNKDIELVQEMQNQTRFNEKKVTFVSMSCDPVEQNEIFSNKILQKDKMGFTPETERQDTKDIEGCSEDIEDNSEDIEDNSENLNSKDLKADSPSSAKTRLLAALRDYISESNSSELNVTTLPMTFLNQLIQKLELLPQKKDDDVSKVQENIIPVTSVCEVPIMATEDNSELNILASQVRRTCTLQVTPTENIGMGLIGNHSVAPSDSHSIAPEKTPSLALNETISPSFSETHLPVLGNVHSLALNDACSIASYKTSSLAPCNVQSAALDEIQSPAPNKIQSLVLDDTQSPALNMIQLPTFDEVQSPAVSEKQSAVLDEIQSPAPNKIQSLVFDDTRTPALSEVQSSALDEVQSLILNPVLNNALSATPFILNAEPIKALSDVLTMKTDATFSKQAVLSTESRSSLIDVPDVVLSEAAMDSLNEIPGTTLVPTDTLSNECSESPLSGATEMLVVGAATAANTSSGTKGVALSNNARNKSFAVAGGIDQDLEVQLLQEATVPNSDTNVALNGEKRVLFNKGTGTISCDRSLIDISGDMLTKDEKVTDVSNAMITNEVPEHMSPTVGQETTILTRQTTETATDVLKKQTLEEALDSKKAVMSQMIPECKEMLKASVEAEENKGKLQRHIESLDATLHKKKVDASLLKKCNPEREEYDEARSSSRHRTINVEPDPALDLVLDSGKKIMDQLQLMIVLLHGAPKGFRPLNTVAEAAFRRDVHDVLKTMMNRLMRMQKYAWPIIQQGHNLVMVGPPMSGKTWAYTIPLLDQILRKVQNGEVPKGNGPVMLILCSGSKSCNEIQETCWRFLQKCGKDVKMMVAYGGGAEKVEFKLINGCHILISTPRCFLRLIGLGKVVVNFIRLKYFVLDEADILTLRFLPEVESICRKVQQDMKSHDKAELQVVASAEKWCPGLKGLAWMLPKPVICIGAFLEALVYARLQPSIHFVSKANRLSVLCEILEKSRANHRTLVVCQETKEVEAAWKILEPQYKQLMMAHDNMDVSDIHDVYVRWSWMEQPILICSDVILQEMRFQGASQLIHFSLPVTSKSQFAFRCSTLLEQLPQMFEDNKEKDCSVPPAMHVFISDTDSEPLPTLVRFLKRVGATVDPDLQHRANEAEMKKELRKDCVPLCYNTKAFGDCWNKSKCIFRHIISNRDKPRNIPTIGNVKVKMIYAHDTCNFSARILEHMDEKGNTVTIPNLILSLTRKLHNYYKHQDHRVLLENPKAHDICATEKPLGVYHRAEILAITKVDRHENPAETLVRLIDDGGRDLIKAERLFVLPDDLKEIFPQSVEIFLCRLIPCDLDWSWGPATNDKMAKIISDANETGRFLVGKIKLSLGHTMWVDPLECYQSLPTLKTSTIIFSLRSKLLDEHLAVENPQHLQLLHRGCEKAGLVVPISSSADLATPIERSEAKIEPCWAHLPVDEFSLVYFIVGDHPGRFYVRQLKFEDLVHKLDKKLDRIAQEKYKSTTDRTLFAGDYCIGKFPIDQSWYRARIESAQEDTLDLFFVDHGDRATVSRSEALPLSEELVTQLPFQAIECCFAGVGPDLGDRWSEKAIDALYNITSKPGTEDGVKLLYAKVLDKKKPADCTGGYKYHVALIEVTAHGRAVLNNTMVAWLLATQTEEQRQQLSSLDLNELSPPVDSSLGEEGEEEDGDENEERVDEVLAEEMHMLSPKDIAFEDDWNTEMTENVLQSEDTSDKRRNVRNENARIEEFLENEFDFNNVTEEEFKEFYEMTMKHYLEYTSKKLKLPAITSREREPSSAVPCNQARTSQETIHEAEDRVTDSLPGESGDGATGTCNISEEDSEDEYRSSVSEDECPMPHLVRNGRVPLVYWRQNAYFVWLKVELPGVKNYYLKWDVDSLEFWTVVNDSVYTFDLHLYGSIDPSTLTHSDGLYIHIKMQKLCVGIDWLRLSFRKEKLPWVKRDYTADNDSDLEDLHLAEQLRAVKVMEKRKEHRIESGGLLPADEVPYDEDDNSDSNCSDVLTPDDEQYDPYDPMN